MLPPRRRARGQHRFSIGRLPGGCGGGTETFGGAFFNDGDLTLLFGRIVELGDGFSVEADGKLTVEHDPSLKLVLEELIEADRARRRELAHQGRRATPADR